MTECEGTDQTTCGTWTFTGIEGTGQWSNGAAANLTIQQFDPNWVIIRRTDTSGTSAGLTAIYVGQQHGQRVEGTVKWTWLGHWNQEVQGTWYATFDEPGSTASASRPQESAPQAGQEARPPVTPDAEKPPQGRLPQVMHWCSLHCTTLIWDDGHYTSASHPGNSIWTVESFTQESVIIHRTDYQPYPGTAVLSGKISDQGDTIVNGTITWTYHPCCGLSSGTFNAAWGAALATVPGSDEERAQAQQPYSDYRALWAIGKCSLMYLGEEACKNEVEQHLGRSIGSLSCAAFLQQTFDGWVDPAELTIGALADIASDSKSEFWQFVGGLTKIGLFAKCVDEND